jgi:PEP-CTERM motif-containing protein
MRHVLFVVVCCGLLMASYASALAAPIASGVFLEFGFGDAGVAATGCDPADPSGSFCIPSSGTLTQFAPAPPWTFLAASGATLTVTDAFISGDRFEIFDFGASIGLTSAPAASGGVDCGDDPVVCLATPGISNGAFALGAGPHAITIVPTLSPDGGGSAYFRVDGATAAVPEPTSLLLLLSGLALTVGAARHRFI